MGFLYLQHHKHCLRSLRIRNSFMLLILLSYKLWGVLLILLKPANCLFARFKLVVSKTHPRSKTETPKSRKRSTLDRKRSTQISKTKHPKLENEAPKSRKRSTLDRKRSTQISKRKTPKLENEAPESGGGSGCVRTSKGPQNLSQGFIRACQLFNWTFLDRIYCINFIIGIAILDTSYLNMHFFRYTYMFM